MCKKNVNNTPLFSICIPIYNTENYLRQCLNSVLAQDFSDFEVIMVDDGSEDSSLEICNEYQDKDARFIAVHQENAGAIAARKTALRFARGKYAIVLDSDDYLANGLLQSLENIITTYEPEIIKLNYARFTNAGVTEFRNKFQNKMFYENDMEVVHSSLIYDRELLGIHTGVSYSLAMTVAKLEILATYQFNVPDNISLGDDLAVTAPMIYDAKSIYFTDTIDYYYRDTPGSMMNVFKTDTLKRIEVLLHYLAEKIPIQYQTTLNVYAVNMIWGYAAGALCKYDKAGFCKLMKSEINDFYRRHINECKISKPSINEFIKLWLLKKEMYATYYIISKILRNKGL